MLSPRWQKVARDLWRGRGRTLLVSLSIALGVIGVGMIGQSQATLARGMADAYTAANPAAITLHLDGFGEELVATARQVPGVADAEGRTVLPGRIHPGTADPNQSPAGWKPLELFGLGNFADVRVGKITRQEGPWPPATGEVLLEWAALDYLGVHVGDTVWLELPGDNVRQVRIAGSLRDIGRATAPIEGITYAYATPATLAALGADRAYDTLSLTVSENALDKKHLQDVAGQVRTKVRAAGHIVFATTIPEPGKHWGADIVISMGNILISVGLLTLVLGACLVINTITALITQQTRQIGVMQVLGAEPAPLTGMYLASVLVYSLIALAVGIPLGQAGSRLMTNHSNELLGFDASGYGPSTLVLAVQVAVGLVIPLLAALYPVIAGTRITVREAIGGTAGGSFGHGALDRLLERIQGLSRPFLLSLRNTFRRKGRLALTLVTLGLGGSIVISLVSLRAAMTQTMDTALRTRNFDVQVALLAPLPAARVEAEARKIAGVSQVESWGAQNANRVRPDGSESGDLQLIAPPIGSDMLAPAVVAGRWFQPGDDGAVVVDTEWLKENQDVRVGDDLTLSVGGRQAAWHVVGVVRKVMSGPTAYVPYPDLAKLMGQEGQATTLQVVTTAHDAAAEARVAADLQARFMALNLPLAGLNTTAQVREVQTGKFTIVLVFLVVMAVLLTVVSSLSLAGTMSLNVLERTREVGILRSIGATDWEVWRIIVGEGVIVGVLGWGVSVLLAVPVSRQLADSVGQAIFRAPLEYAFPVSGPLWWLGAAVVLSAVASFLPAYSASRLTVRDVLAYE